MQHSVCAQCHAVVDACWRWCPECGSLRLLDRQAIIDLCADEFSVDWEIEGDCLGGSVKGAEGPGGDRPEVGSRA